jgi:hypothetical protein
MDTMLQFIDLTVVLPVIAFSGPGLNLRFHFNLVVMSSYFLLILIVLAFLDLDAFEMPVVL